MKKINWGIIGLGKIAHSFTKDLLRVDDAVVYAVASRNKEKAVAFANQFGAKKAYSSYDQLINDNKVDVIYIATPHAFHYDIALRCIRAKKNVLCEKPMCLHLEEVAHLIEEAQRMGCFLMEAIWTRFMPSTLKLVDLLNKNRIGDIMALEADFGFKAKCDPQGRLFNPALGGGSLMDIGIYPIFLSLLCLGVPNTILAKARKSISDVDASCAMIFGYQEGQLAILKSTFEYQTPCEAELFGTNGSIKIHSRFHEAEKITVLDEQRNKVEEFELPLSGKGYVHEINEVNYCLKQGKKQSDILPLAFSYQLASIIEEVKNKIGLIYP